MVLAQVRREIIVVQIRRLVKSRVTLSLESLSDGVNEGWQIGTKALGNQAVSGYIATTGLEPVRRLQTLWKGL